MTTLIAHPRTGSPLKSRSPRSWQEGASIGAARIDGNENLVTGLWGRDRDAAEILVARYADRLYRLAIRITGSEQDAEEVIQDALWTATRKIDTF